jgi:hypothetical protein
LVYIDNSDNLNGDINIEGLEIRNITNFQLGSSFFNIKNSNSTLNFESSLFSENNADTLININDIYGKIILENLTFFKNNVNSQIVNLLNIYDLFLSDLLSDQTNNKCENDGGFLRSENIFFRQITNLTVSNSCSSQTTVGVKFIDMDIDLLMNSFQEIDQPYVHFNIQNNILIISFRLK